MQDDQKKLFLAWASQISIDPASHPETSAEDPLSVGTHMRSCKQQLRSHVVCGRRLAGRSVGQTRQDHSPCSPLTARNWADRRRVLVGSRSYEEHDPPKKDLTRAGEAFACCTACCAYAPCTNVVPAPPRRAERSRRFTGHLDSRIAHGLEGDQELLHLSQVELGAEGGYRKAESAGTPLY